MTIPEIIYKYPKFNVSKVFRYHGQKVKIMSFRYNVSSEEFEYAIIELPIKSMNPIWIREESVYDSDYHFENGTPYRKG